MTDCSVRFSLFYCVFFMITVLIFLIYEVVCKLILLVGNKYTVSSTMYPHRHKLLNLS